MGRGVEHLRSDDFALKQRILTVLKRSESICALDFQVSRKHSGENSSGVYRDRSVAIGNERAKVPYSDKYLRFTLLRLCCTSTKAQGDISGFLSGMGCIYLKIKFGVGYDPKISLSFRYLAWGIVKQQLDVAMVDPVFSLDKVSLFRVAQFTTRSRAVYALGPRGVKKRVEQEIPQSRS
jgi:hypothetical protein